MFRLGILKLTAFCNLDCSYCYMFNLADDTFMRMPKFMPLEVSVKALDRIAEHMRAHEVSEFHVTLHGGEPTLWPVDSFRAFLAHVERLRADGISLSLSLQTNGMRLPPQLLRLFADHGVSLGVSLDGPRAANDSNRVTHSGAGSYDVIMRNVHEILGGRFSHLISGFLSVANPDIPVEEYFEWMNALPLRRMDVLWPMHFNYQNKPWADGGELEYRTSPRYGTWFADLFELWWKQDDPSLYVRFFYDVIETILGSPRHIENIVNDTAPIFVVNCDGGLEYHDYMRGTADGLTRTAYTVQRNLLDEAVEDPVFQFLLHLGEHTPDACGGCRFRRLCGGGFLPGRMDSNILPPRGRSVLCYDEFHCFERIAALIGPALPQDDSPLEPLSEVLVRSSSLPRPLFASWNDPV
jgi:uncharacterized protein